ncbi:hypothetical protein ACFX13_046116 [Malus domestica]
MRRTILLQLLWALSTVTHVSKRISHIPAISFQKAHVQKFLATEDALKKAAEVRDLCQKLIKRLHGNTDVISSGTSQNVGSLRQLELEVWAKEREVAGLRASLNTLMSEIQRLNKLCAEGKEVEGLEGSDAALASILESLEFCSKLRGSEASVLEDMVKAINLVHTPQDLVESGHVLLNHAYRAQQEYERTTSYCLNVAAEQEKIVMEKWLPELKAAILSAQKCLEDCNYVRGLLDEWWEQPAATVVDWVLVDGLNVAAWHNHVKQLLAFYDQEHL